MNASIQADYPAAAFIRSEIKPERHPEVAELFRRYESAIYRRTHHLFLGLLSLQWVLGVGVAYVWSPTTWTGSASVIHPHLIAAIFLGGLLVAPAVALMTWAPEEAMTRHVVAISQMGFSSLLIHLTGGRLEAHFHIFGSLAFLALYRDWRVLPTATAIVLIDHLVSGIWFPSSIYGVSYATVYRSYEHAGWVVFECAVLGWSCVVSRREMWLISVREDENSRLIGEVEGRLIDRTAAFGKIQERTSTMIRHLPIGIFEVARSGEVLFANERMLAMLGLADRGLPGGEIPVDATLNPGDHDRLWAALDRDGEVRSFESVLHLGNGTRANIVINARIKFDADGRPDICEGSASDETHRKKAEHQLEHLNEQLVAASRQVGMAEAATGVLHNVGNVLTSVNLTVHDMQDRLGSSRISHLRRVVDLIEANQAKLPEYISTDPTGTQVPTFLVSLAKHLESENRALRDDMVALSTHFEHIREIIVAQQSSARILGIVEDISTEALLEDALRLAAESFDRHHIGLSKQIEAIAVVRTDRHKVLQVLINLLKNAKDALLHLDKPDRCIMVRVFVANETFAAISVSDNGTGIARENLTQIFHHGFTTKKDGHGFGLHSAAIAAKEVKGDLTAESAGLGQGSTFTLLLPLSQVPAP